MSRAIVAHCFNVENLTRSEKAVLLAMADYAGNHGVCYAAQEKIGDKVGYSIRTVRNAIKALCEKGILKYLKRGITKVYKIVNLRERNNYPAKAKTYEAQYRKPPPNKKISPDENRQKTTIEPAKTAAKQVKTSSLSTHNRESLILSDDNSVRNERPTQANQTPPATLKDATPASDSCVKKWKGPTRQADSNKSNDVVLADWKPVPGFDYYADLKAAVKGKSGTGLFKGLMAAMQPDPEPRPSDEFLLAQAKKAFGGDSDKKKKIVSKAAAKQLQDAGLWNDDDYEVLS